MGSVPKSSGTLVVGSVADPLVQDSFEILTGAGVLMRVIGFRFTLTTDANVADRSVFYEIRDATRIISRVMHTRSQAANLTGHYSAWSGFNGVTAFVGIEYLMPFPNNYMQTNTFNVYVFGLNIQAGDQFSDIAYAAEEWIGDG